MGLKFHGGTHHCFRHFSIPGVVLPASPAPMLVRILQKRAEQAWGERWAILTSAVAEGSRNNPSQLGGGGGPPPRQVGCLSVFHEAAQW